MKQHDSGCESETAAAASGPVETGAAAAEHSPQSAAPGPASGGTQADKEYRLILVYRGGKRLGFVTPRGGTNRLRVHASIFHQARAELARQDLETDNPGLTFKVVK